MAKRFIDSELLLNPSLRVIPPLYKVFWITLITRCDHAGIWIKDFEMATLLCGGQIKEIEAMTFFKHKIVEVDNGMRWFLPSFIDFQYPKGLKMKVAAHKSVINILYRYGLWDNENKRVIPTLNEPLANPYMEPLQDMVMDKDKELDKDKIKDQDKEKKETPSDYFDILQSVSSYFNVFELGTTLDAYKTISLHLTKIETLGEWEAFKTQFKAFKQYKSESEESQGYWKSFFGDFGEDGGRWRQADWTKKIGVTESIESVKEKLEQRNA